MRIAFSTLGCKVNQYETSALTGVFASRGFDISSADEEADIYVLNSCTVTGESDRKARQLLRRFKKRNPAAIVAVCGCLPQAMENPAENLPEADIIIGAKNRSYLFEAVSRKLAGEDRIIEILPYEKKEGFENFSISSFPEHIRAFVKIQDGCERFCSYCIIPHARGPIRSRKLDELKQELTDLAHAGYKEVVLVGINLSCYGFDCGLKLIDAVNLACSVDGIERVRLGSLEPELLSNDDIAALARQKKLCPQFHLSLQSGCDATLARMNRHYNTSEYKRIVDKLREVFEDVAITTDIMVGFPQETAEEFEQSVNFVKEIGFARSHVFAYSKRPGTPAAYMEGQISKALKSARSKRMIEACGQSAQNFLTSMAAKTVNVLFETKRSDGMWEGYSENYTPVAAFSLDNIAGKILPVTLSVIEGDCYNGVIV